MDFIYCRSCWVPIASPLDKVYDRMDRENSYCHPCGMAETGTTPSEVKDERP